MIDKAKYVVTESFYGTAFANLFEKEFYSHITCATKLTANYRFSANTLAGKQPEDITIQNLHVDFTCNRNVIIEERKKSDFFYRKLYFSL